MSLAGQQLLESRRPVPELVRSPPKGLSKETLGCYRAARALVIGLSIPRPFDPSTGSGRRRLKNRSPCGAINLETSS